MMIMNTPTSISHKDPTRRRPEGTEALPKGMVSKTLDLLMQPFMGSLKQKGSSKDMNSKSSTDLLAIAVELEQKKSVNKIVKKFPSSHFVVVLFSLRGHVNEWRD
ncbi:hypothetical protein TB2_034805 [Malus domestica]